MKRKPMCIILAIAAVVCIPFCFAACGDGNDHGGETPGGDEPTVHSHSYSLEWSSDNEYHWHACTSKNGTCDAPKSGNARHEWDEGEMTDEPTDEHDGTFTYTCVVCGRTKDQKIPYTPPEAHEHTLTEHAANSATCTQDGNIAYWTCSGCGKYFSDEGGNNEITAADTVAASSGHTLVERARVEPGCVDPGYAAHWECTVCEKWFSDEAGKNIVDQDDIQIDPTMHSFIKHDEKPSTCTEHGNEEYYECSTCNKLYRTGSGDFLITLEDTVRPLADHDFVDGVCTVCEGAQPDSVGLEFEAVAGTGYKLKGKGACTDTQIKIPSTYEGLPVIAIGDEAFSGDDSLVSVYIPESVCSIGEKAFWYCSQLKYIKIGGHVSTISAHALHGCAKLTSLHIPALDVTTIGDHALAHSGVTSVTMGDKVRTIGNNAFEYCSSLEALTLSNAVESIGNAAFKRTGIKTLELGTNLTTIGNEAFEECRDLETVTFKFRLETIGAYAFSKCESLKSISIPDSVTSLGIGAFQECAELTTVSIGKGVTNIGGGYFSYCPKIESLTVSSNNANYYSEGNCIIKKIGGSNTKKAVVVGCKTSVIPGDSELTTINSRAFCGSGLTSITIPANITKIDNYAFSDCKSITSVTLSNGVETIGNEAFSGCSELVTINMSDDLNRIGQKAFLNCSKLTGVVVADGVERLEMYAFSNCSALTSVTIGSGVTDIEYGAFSGCGSLTTIDYRGTEEQWQAITKGENWWNGDSEPTINYLS